MSETQAPITVIGQLSNASNTTLLVERDARRFIYKPKSGERELWDFPTGTLYQRERAAFVLSELLNWNLVPETQISDGPHGIGIMQKWIEAQVDQVDIFTPVQIPSDWISITSGVDETGNQVVLAHSTNDQLKLIALFDVLINNADRKAGHILTDSESKLWAIDHGVTFNVEPKLRTVLWGWIDQSIEPEWLLQIEKTKSLINRTELIDLLTSEEIEALLNRIEMILAEKKFPAPSPHWPAVPWPVF